jgi:antitoxin component YwqK of YwqJK toxin-antitoxin module
MRLLTILCLVLLSVHSYSQEVVTGPFLIRDGITYHQDTNQLVTGIIETFHENGQLEVRGNYIDGELDGLWEEFYENGQLESRGNLKDGEWEGWLAPS